MFSGGSKGNIGKKRVNKNEMQGQVVCNILDDLKIILEKVLISRMILFKKIAMMHSKGEFSKIKGSISNITIEAANICIVLPRPAVSNGFSHMRTC